MDIASPALSLACAVGMHIDEVVIEMCRAGTDKVKFMKHKLEKCLIYNIQVFICKSIKSEGI